MAKLNQKIVHHVAKLSRLALTPAQSKKFQSQLSSVLGYMSKIQKLKTENVPETHQVTGLTNVFRQDKVDKSRLLTQKQALSNASKTHQGYFLVKSVFS